MSPVSALGRPGALIALAMALDVGLGGAASLAGVPLALDSTGAALAGALGGPIVGVLGGLAGGALVGWSVPGGGSPLTGALVHAVVGVVAASASRTGALRRIGPSLAVGAGAGVAAAGTALLAGRLTTGSAPLAAFLLGAGRGPVVMLAALGVAHEVLDKAITFALVGRLVTWLPPRSAADPSQDASPGV